MINGIFFIVIFGVAKLKSDEIQDIIVLSCCAAEFM